MSFFYQTNLTAAAKSGVLDLADIDLKVAPVDLLRFAPTPADQTLGDIPSEALLGDAMNLQGVTFERGVLDADDVAFGQLGWGARLGMAIYAPGRRGAVMDELLCLIETNTDTNGGEVTVQWNKGPHKIARLFDAAQRDVDLRNIRTMTNALDELAAACFDDQGSPKAPDKEALMKARSMLPSWCSTSLTKTKGE